MAVAVSPRVRDRRAYFRLVWHFAWFQFMMTLAGALVGSGISTLVASVGKYISCAILAAVAGHMFFAALKGENHPSRDRDPTRGWSLVALSLATSLDALAVGVGYGLVEAKALEPSVVIGVVAGLMTFVGLRLGLRLASKLGAKAEFLGATILAILAVRQLC